MVYKTLQHAIRFFLYKIIGTAKSWHKAHLLGPQWEETARELFWVTEIFYTLKVHMTVYGHQNALILY